MINRRKTQRLFIAKKGWQSDGNAAAGVLWARNTFSGASHAPPALELRVGRASLAFLRFATKPCTTRWPQGGGSGCSTLSISWLGSASTAIPDTSIFGRSVVRELTELIVQRGKPNMIVSDIGTERASNAVLAWCGEISIDWHCIETLSMSQSHARVRSPHGWKTTIKSDCTHRLATQLRRRSLPNWISNGLSSGVRRA